MERMNREVAFFVSCSQRTTPLGKRGNVRTTVNMKRKPRHHIVQENAGILLFVLAAALIP